MRAFLGVLFLLGFLGCAAERSAETLFNQVCPVMGKPVNPKVKTVSYNGKVYGFCCSGCDKKFAADPARYATNLSADGKTFLGNDTSTHP